MSPLRQHRTRRTPDPRRPPDPRRQAGQTARAALGWAAVVGALAGWAWLGTLQPIVQVVSPSMAPTLSVGDVALMRDLRQQAPGVGDIVAVPVPEDVQKQNRYPAELVHRVHEIRDGRVVTKGDNLDQPDPFDVAVGDIDRGLVTVVPGAGRVLGYLTSPYGLVWLGVGGVLLLGPPLVRGLVAAAAPDTGPVPAAAAGAGAPPAADAEALNRLATAVEAQNEILRHLAGSPPAARRTPPPAARRTPPPSPLDDDGVVHVDDLLALRRGWRDATPAPDPAPEPKLDPAPDPEPGPPEEISDRRRIRA